MKKTFTLLILAMSCICFSCSNDSDNEPKTPDMPQGLIVEGSSEEITLTWSAPNYEGKLIYDIYLQEAQGDNLLREIKKVTDTSYTYVVKYGGVHTFKVRARAFESATAASEFAVAEINVETPSLFTDLRAIQQILDKNPENTLGWEFDLTDQENPKIIKGEGANKDDKTITLTKGRVTGLNTSYGNITNLEDIRYLGNLERLLCRGTATHKLKTLNISKNKALTYLICSGNELTSVDISKHSTMSAFNAASNKLKAIDVSKNFALSTFNVSGNTDISSIVFTTTHDKLGNVNVTGLPEGAVTIPQSIINKIGTLAPAATDPVYNITP